MTYPPSWKRPLKNMATSHVISEPEPARGPHRVQYDMGCVTEEFPVVATTTGNMSVTLKK